MTVLDDAVAAFLRDGIVKIPGVLDFSSDSLLNGWRNDLLMNLHDAPPGLAAPPPTKKVKFGDISPDLWALCKLLLGGSDAVKEAWLTNGTVANIGTNNDQIFGWHTDGDFFRHFINSPEQGLLIIVLWTDVSDFSGPTHVVLDSVGPVASVLNAHPEGILQMDLPYGEIVESCSDAVPMTGKAGDVFLMHPFMIHSASPKFDDGIRLISNPVVSRERPFDLRNGGDCPVAQYTLSKLGEAKLVLPRVEDYDRILPPRMIN